MSVAAGLDTCLAEYDRLRHHFDIFGAGVRDFFAKHPELAVGSLPVIHSVRYRIKDRDHLREKITRKSEEKKIQITPSNLFSEITDITGVRVLHLHKYQFESIHATITKQVADQFWYLAEPPVAYTWDPELQTFYDGLGIATKFKESQYTSVHYVVRPNKDQPFMCEIQVRTLFEEAWGEIDHFLNYPKMSSDVACIEQLKVLSKIVGAGTRLAESIFRSREAAASEKTELTQFNIK